MVGAILQARARELRNSLLRDPQRRVMLLVAIAVNLALGIWGATQLQAGLSRWLTLGPGELDRRLWRLCLAAWGAAAGMGLVSVRELGFGDRARLLFTLPVERAARLRALLGLVTLQAAAGVGLALACVLAALARGLGARGASWIVLLVAGMGVSLWGALVIQTAVIAAARPAWRRRVVTTAAAGLVIAAGAAITLSASGGGRWVRAAAAALSPGGAALLAALALLAAAGPLAGPAGAIYEAAFVQDAGARRARPRRALRRLTRGFAGWRGPAGALLTREMLTRGRHWVEWLRAGVFAAALFAGFPLLRPTLTARGLPLPLAIAGTVVALAVLFIFDSSTSPLGAEGSRLLLFLTAPLSPGALLRAKLLALLAPLAGAGAVGGAVLAAAGGLSWTAAAWTVAAILLVLLGVAAVFSLGSAWDVDLELEIEPGLRGFVQETAPTTVPRMVLFLAASALAAAELWLLARLPALPGLLAAAAADAALLAALLRPAEHALLRQVREG